MSRWCPVCVKQPDFNFKGRESLQADASKDKNEAGLLQVYRENLCGDAECQGARYSAAQSVLRGAIQHRELADIVHNEMQLRSIEGVGDERFTQATASATQDVTDESSVPHESESSSETVEPIEAVDLLTETQKS